MCLKHCVLHIVCILPSSWLKMFFLFKFRDYIKLTALHPPNSYLYFWAKGFSFKLNLVLKTMAAVFSDVNPAWRRKIDHVFLEIKKRHSVDQFNAWLLNYQEWQNQEKEHWGHNLINFFHRHKNIEQGLPQ